MIPAVDFDALNRKRGFKVSHTNIYDHTFRQVSISDPLDQPAVLVRVYK